MSVTVPTAESEAESGATPGRRPAPPGRWLVGAAVLAAVGMLSLVSDPDERLAAPVTDPVPPPEAGVAGGRAPPMPVFPHEWSQSVFPGSGWFTSVATASHGGVAIGQRTPTEAFVWTSADLGRWTRRDIAGHDRAVVRTVTPWQDGFVVGGALLSPGSGTSEPALWYGTAAGSFELIDPPFPGPGRVDAVRVVHGELVVLGQGTGPFQDNLTPGYAKYGRVYATRGGEWVDLTPEGFSVLVTEVIGTPDGWLAVGSVGGRGAIWLGGEGGGGWEGVAPPGVEDVVFTDVVAHADGRFTAVARSWDFPGGVRTRLYRSEGIERWRAVTEPRPFDVGWVAAVEGGVVGGQFNSVGPVPDFGKLWAHSDLTGWTALDVVDPAYPLVGLPLSLRSMDGGVLVGEYAGQPTMWREGDFAAPQPVVELRSETWERIGPAPGAATTIGDTGEHLVAITGQGARTRVSTSPDGRSWRSIELEDGFAIDGVSVTERGVLIWGVVAGDGLVLDIAGDGDRWMVHSAPGVSPTHALLDDGALVVFGAGTGGPVRVRHREGDTPVVTPLRELPDDMFDHHAVLIAGSGLPLDSLRYSTDLGETWTSIDVPVWGLAALPDARLPTSRPVVITAELPQRVLAVDPESGGVTEIDSGGLLSGDGRGRVGATGWAGGVAVSGSSAVRLLAASGEVVTVPRSPEHGMPGSQLDLIPGPRGYARALVAGEYALYRWTGASR